MKKEKQSVVPENPTTEIRTLGLKKDVAFAQQLYPTKTIYAALRPTDIVYQKQWNEFLCIALAGFCFAAPCLFPEYLNKQEVLEHTLYILTEDSLVYHVEDFSPTCQCCFAAGRSSREIELESILAVETDGKGQGCVCCATPFVDVFTASDQQDQGRVKNALFVDDVHSLSALIKELQQRAKNARGGVLVQSVVSGAEGCQMVSEGFRCFVAAEQSPSTLQMVKIEAGDSWESFKSKIQTKLDMMYVNSVKLQAGGSNIEINNVLDIQNNDKLIIS